MKNELRLLIVEDDSEEQRTWRMQIEQHNAIAQDSNSFSIAHTFAATKEVALTLIENGDFDAAIIDLGLATSEGHKEANSHGNDVAVALIESELAVVVIFTGQPSDVSTALRGKNVEVIKKGDGTKEVMDLLKKNAPMILTIRAAGVAIKKEMAALFSTSIWPRWKFWVSDGNVANVEVTAAVTRHLASHVYAALLEKGRHTALPEEWYFVPPIRDGLRTGDLVEIARADKSGSDVAIVITPRCDLANNPGKDNQTYQLAFCEDVSADYKTRNDKYQAVLKAKPADGHDKKIISDWKNEHARTKESLRGLIQHRNKNIFHFLHQMRMTDGSVRGPFLIRFDQIFSVNRDSPEGVKLAAAIRLASVAPEFLPSIVERLGTYFSRIGTPDYSFIE